MTPITSRYTATSPERLLRLRGLVIAWTILTTTFTWTPTMRMLLKPEISQWAVFGIGGSGGAGPFWMLPSLSLFALVLFYIEGRGKLRRLFHVLLLAWHVPLAGIFVYWSVRHGTGAEFMGAAWGITIPFPVLAVPFAVFAALAVLLVIRETRDPYIVDVQSWGRVRWGRLVLAGLLLPVAFLFFRLGGGYDLLVKTAIAATVLQWILLAEGLGPRGGISASSPARRGAAE